MSEPHVPPPLPPLAQPIPVQPLAELAHEDEFQPEDYGSFRHRPGIITAISVLSITIGSLGMITGGISGLYGGLFYFVARQAATVQANVAAAAAQPVAPLAVTDDETDDPNAPPTVGERGLELPARQIIIDVLATQRPLNDARKHQLHALLAKAGQDVFPNSGGGVASVDISRAISESGQLPRASDSDTSEGPDYFVIATGRIEVSEDRALFEPSDRSLETVRVKAPLPTTDADGTTASPGPSAMLASGISTRDMQTAVKIVSQRTGNRLTSQQRRTLIAEFSSRRGLLLPSTAWMPIGSQLLNSIVEADGTVLVLTSHGQLQIGPTGLVQSRLIYGNTTPFGTAGGPFNNGTGKSPISGAAATVVVAESVLSILLSIYLLVIGILSLRQTPRGRRLHLIYALLKIPLAIVCGIGWCWFIGGFFSAIPNGGNAQIQTVRAVVLIFVTGVALLYPIGLFITFSTATVKRYYDSGQ